MLIAGWFKVVHDRESKRKERRGKEGSEKEKKGKKQPLAQAVLLLSPVADALYLSRRCGA